MKQCIFWSVIFFCSVLSAVNHEHIHYVKSKYEQTLFGKTCLFFPALNPKRLLITFTYKTGNPLYSAWSWFWQENEQWTDTAYLFLYDQRNFWYINASATDKTEEEFSSVMSFFIEKLGISKQQVFTFGSSMGGYGALYYAITLGYKGAIIFNPQITGTCTSDSIGKSKWFKNITTVIRNTQHIPFISLNISSYGEDVCSGIKLMEVVLEKNTFAILRKIRDKKHNQPQQFKFDRDSLLKEIAFMESQPVI